MRFFFVEENRWRIVRLAAYRRMVERNNFTLNCQRCVTISLAIILVGVEWLTIFVLPLNVKKECLEVNAFFLALEGAISDFSNYQSST